MTINELVAKLKDLADTHGGDMPVCLDEDFHLYLVKEVDTCLYGDQPLVHETDPWFNKTVVRLR